MLTASACIGVLNFFFRLLYAIAYNCVHNCEDQPSFDFISAVHMINFIYITCIISLCDKSELSNLTLPWQPCFELRNYKYLCFIDFDFLLIDFSCSEKARGLGKMDKSKIADLTDHLLVSEPAHPFSHLIDPERQEQCLVCFFFFVRVTC